MAISLRLAGETEHISADAARHRAERPPFLPETPAPSAPGKGPPPLLGGGHRVLVVDDNEIVLKAFEMKLRAKGFVVATTTNSATVASTVEQAGAELIILDVNFPAASTGAVEWNGFMVMQWLKRFPELGKIPVILISGADTAQYQQKALEAGAVAFFQKPLDFEALLKIMLKTLEKK